jgi:SNF2 family DNA or RNA helicase
VDWADRLEPFHHQVQNLITFCRRLPVTLLADDVGLGKTISAGLILSELMARRRVSRALVLCPKILGPQWVEELDEKFGVGARFVTGKELDAELTGTTPVVVSTYHSGAERLEQVEAGAFDMLILDEAHKLRNLHGSPKPPKMASRVRSALEQRLFKFVLMLTATPMQNRIWDLYSLIDLLTVARGHKHPLGTAQEFEQRFLQPRCSGRKLNPHGADEFRHTLKQYIARTTRTQARLPFPARVVERVSVALTPDERGLADIVAQHKRRPRPTSRRRKARRSPGPARARPGAARSAPASGGGRCAAPAAPSMTPR